MFMGKIDYYNIKIYKPKLLIYINGLYSTRFKKIRTFIFQTT
jgi:hypothetical protein